MDQINIESTLARIDEDAAALRSIQRRLAARRETFLHLRVEFDGLLSVKPVQRPAPPDARMLQSLQIPAPLADMFEEASAVEIALRPEIPVPPEFPGFDFDASAPSLAEPAADAPPAVPPPSIEHAVEPEAVSAAEPAVESSAAATTLMEAFSSVPPLIEPGAQEAAADTLVAAPVRPRCPSLPIPMSVLGFISVIAVIASYNMRLPAAQPRAEAAAPSDEGSAEALALVHAFRMSGDERSLLERLGGVSARPNGTWRTEIVGLDSYIVIYREPAGTPSYAFEVDLNTKTVLPTPEATNRLTLLRVRDQITAQINSPSL